MKNFRPVQITLHCFIKNVCFIFAAAIILHACTVSRQINKQAVQLLLHDSVISTGHTGISIYEPASGKYWYNYEATKYFVPASNTKLFSLYAGLKYLGDSLAGIRYHSIKNATGTITEIIPTGDPTFLHPKFAKQPVLDFLKKQQQLVIKKIPAPVPLGMGWAWDDYMEKYMAPRSVFPMYGNVIKLTWIDKNSLHILPGYFAKHAKNIFSSDSGFAVTKQFGNNQLLFGAGTDKEREIAFEPDTFTVIKLLADTLKNVIISYASETESDEKKFTTLYAQLADSIFTPMMHNSDNFFAEQTLLMAASKRLGYMNEVEMIDTLLSTDLKDIPQRPKWVDGSGLSRYNLFTPQDFIYILNKMKNEFGFERLKQILPTGNTGTLKNYYVADSNYIFAKTGTLSNHIGFSGFLITKKKRLLIFSVLNSHFVGRATAVRRAVEQFIQGLREKY